MKELRFDEKKMDEAQGNMNAMRFMAQQEKASKFQSKRNAELTKLLSTPNHTRSSVRVKFPDGYVIQGTFGALEKIEHVYKFISENIFYKPDQRQFYLYETPPKKVYDQKTYRTSLIKANLVPSCLLYFAWSDIP